VPKKAASKRPAAAPGTKASGDKKAAASKKAPAGKKPTGTRLIPARKIVAAEKPASPKKASAPASATAKVKVPASSNSKAVSPNSTAAKKPATANLSEKELAALRAELEEHQTVLVREWDDLEQGSFNVPQSELSGEVSFDEEYADAGTFTFERERDLSLGNNIRDLLSKVQAALRKLDGKGFGLCERCGRPIDKTRLKALPYSSLCIQCKQQEERVR
jgi:DnaK suppressor protein